MRPLRIVMLACALAGCRTPRPDELGPLQDVPTTEVSAPDAPDVADVTAPRDPTRVRLATYNVHRLFDAVCDSGRCAPGDFEALPSPAAFEAQADRIARAIALLDADAVCLQEVENQAALDRVHAHLGAAFPTAVLGETGAPASVDVAVVARDPVLEVVRHRAARLQRPDGSPTLFARELLEVHLDHAGRRVVLVCAHFRSMVNDDPGRREAEAAGARVRVEAAAQMHPDAVVALAGDLNDDPGSPPLTALESGGGLVRVTQGRDASEVATYVYQGTTRMLDHILVPTALAPRVVPEDVQVHWDRWQRTGWGASDHAALSAVLRLGE
jgi:endonuclease/exonuclease/phosphatase family metal-dependent hydrolase